MILHLLAAAAATPALPPAEPCDGRPVLMVVAGPTYDRARMQAYGKAIADSKLYERLGGYYLNAPVILDTFEGAPPAGYTTIIVRFPCLANARAFWHSEEYQNKIKPLRLGPAAGDYIVTVYPEVPVRADLKDKVGDSAYRARFPADGVAQKPR